MKTFLVTVYWGKLLMCSTEFRAQYMYRVSDAIYRRIDKFGRTHLISVHIEAI